MPLFKCIVLFMTSNSGKWHEFIDFVTYNYFVIFHDWFLLFSIIFIHLIYRWTLVNGCISKIWEHTHLHLLHGLMSSCRHVSPTFVMSLPGMKSRIAYQVVTDEVWKLQEKDMILCLATLTKMFVLWDHHYG